MQRLLLLLLMASLGTDLCQSGRDCEEDLVVGSQDGPHDLECHFTGQIEKGLICSWTPGMQHTNATLYKLNIFWKERGFNSTFPDISGVLHTIPRNKLYISEYATMWVTTMNMCQRSKSITLIPLESGRPETPSNIKYFWESGHLNWSISNKYLYQIMIRKAGTTNWHVFNFTQSALPQTLEQMTTYEFRVRHKTLSTPGLWSLWTNTNYVLPELTNMPRIYSAESGLLPNPGKRSVSLRWEKPAEILNTSVFENTTYTITIQRQPVVAECAESTFNTSNEEYTLNLSQASFRVKIHASNSAGKSPADEKVIPPFNEMRLRNKINATPLGNDSIFIRWNSIKAKMQKYVVDWGPVIGNATSDIHSEIIRNKLQNYTLKGKFKPMQRYRIMLHRRIKNCRRLVISEETIGIVDVYTVEGTPRIGPTNIKVTNILKSSVVIKWDPIPEDECQGFLQGYKIVCYSKDFISNNLTFISAVSVNSTSTNCTLRGLLQNTFYAIEISGLTKAGEGAKSHLVTFEIKDFGDGELTAVAVGVCIAIIIFVLLVAWTCLVLVQRVKKLFWPNIPNPGNSHAICIMQRGSSEPHLVAESLYLNSNLLKVEREEELENLHTIEEITSSLTDYGLQEDKPNNALDQKFKSNLTVIKAVIQVTDYTTMEHFQQIMPIITSSDMTAQHARSQTECNGQYQQRDILVPSYVKQRVHHASTQTAEGNPLIALASECQELR
ncbi:interleukin-6 receptor subunit beta isoform X2 [Narcine bancroftii]|uniref:interleukin-6 receptor subunit beta isoform X2 n=1 Tax=Narcine bancroftii TaxID=1343680 RepID=UPI003831A254